MTALARPESMSEVAREESPSEAEPAPVARLVPQPSPTQRSWLQRGVAQPGGKLPLFDERGQRISPRTIQSCIEQGWAEPWFANPIKPDWLVCKLTDQGRRAILAE